MAFLSLSAIKCTLVIPEINSISLSLPVALHASVMLKAAQQAAVAAFHLFSYYVYSH